MPNLYQADVRSLTLHPEEAGVGVMAEGGRDWLRLPVVTAGSEHLVMGHLMRLNILTYKAPPGNEGY